MPDRTVDAAIRWAAGDLRARGVAEPGLEAQLLLGHVLGWNRARVLARPAAPLSGVELTLFLALVARRGRREPYAYLVGSRQWLDLDLLVDRNVLIPRPETERLAALGVAAAARSAAAGDAHPLVVDVGTGSGALAIAVARGWPAARVSASDTSVAALKTAASNVDRIAPGRVRLHLSAYLGDQPAAPDLVVANLPYIPTAGLETLEPELKYEPRQALDGGPDGLDPIRGLLAQARRTLKPGATLLLECGHDQAGAVMALARGAWPSAAIATHADLAGIARFVEIQL